MKKILLWVKMQLMFPDGYAANLKRGASLDKLKIFGLKSHDWLNRADNAGDVAWLHP